MEEHTQRVGGYLLLATDAALALAFLAAWIAPELVGVHRVPHLVLLALVAILDTFVAAFLGFGVRAKGWRWFTGGLREGAAARGVEFVLLSLFFGAFYLVFGLAFGTLVPLLAFLRTLAVMLLAPARDPVAKAYLHLRVVYMVGAMLLFGLASVIVPWPALGVSPDMVPVAEGTTGEFVERPQTALVFGLLFYGGFAAFEGWILRLPPARAVEISQRANASPGPLD